MRFALLAFLAACSSCLDKPASVAADPLAALTVVDPPRAAEAVTIALAAYEHEIGVHLPPVHVTFVTERIPYEDTTVIGLHRGCDDIWVTWWEGPAFSRLGLAHEIGHCVRATIGLPSDPMHEDATWWAKDENGVVGRVNRQLAGAGL